LESCFNLGFGGQRATHGAAIGDLDESLSLLVRQISFEFQDALNAVNLAFFRFAALAVLGVDLGMVQAHTDLPQGPPFAIGIHAERHRGAAPQAGKQEFVRIRPRVAAVTDKSVEQLIIDEAQRQNVELIVMGAYGRSRLAEFFLGSVTSRVIDESPVPLFLFH
jgi:nucleotide-binding universal stress UspA family protein